MDKSGEARIERLEESLAHLMRQSEDLSAIIARQQDQIDRLSRRVGLLMEREAERESDLDGSLTIADQRPPHW